MDAVLAAALHPRPARESKRRFIEDTSDRLAPRRRERAKVATDAFLGQHRVGLVRIEHFAGIHPQIVDRRLYPRMALVGPVAETNDPVGAALGVIHDFLLR